MSDQQKPRIGRIVHYRPLADPGQEVPLFPAIITRVWSDTCVNLTIFADAAAPYSRTSVLHESQTTTGLNAWSWPPRADAPWRSSA